MVFTVTKFYEFIFIQIFKNKWFKVKKIKNQNLSFLYYNQPGLFSILGPEGVGKSTLCFNIQILNSSIKFHTFHHTGAWKNKEKRAKLKW